MGIEILIDPTRKRKPYPTEEAMIFTVPLSGEPSIKTYQPVFRDSTTYQLNKVRVKTRSDFDYSIEKRNRSGFSITFSIPQYLLGKSLPDEIGYNIIVKTADAKGKIVSSSLINASGYNNYSPFLWAALSFLPKPIFKERWLILIVFFCTGLLLPLLVHFILLWVVKDRPIVILHKQSDAVKRTFNRIKETIDRAIIRKDLTAGEIAAELNMAPKELEATIKKITRMTFGNYVMYLRTEIVCERLRSSHSSQASIAETCGFRSAKEMERYFERFHHMTTSNFRKSQQVTQAQ
jgi:AraC-like DNA-binding protein